MSQPRSKSVPRASPFFDAKQKLNSLQDEFAGKEIHTNPLKVTLTTKRKFATL